VRGTYGQTEVMPVCPGRGRRGADLLPGPESEPDKSAVIAVTGGSVCANLNSCDESTHPATTSTQLSATTVNHFRNMRLGAACAAQSAPTSRSVYHRRHARSSHPQYFPQVGHPPDWSGACLLPYSPDSLLPPARLAKRVELCRKASSNLPMGPLRCLARMISAFPLSVGSSCL
jgi:hypothetical protein